MKKVSVIIPAHNRLGILANCLETVFRQDYQNIEVIVIDDNSSEAIGDFINKRYPSIKYMKNNRTRYPSFVKNEGILLSEGDYVLFLDSDTRLVRADTISNSVKILEENEKVGVVGGEAVVDADGSVISVSGVKFEFKKDRVVDVRDSIDQKTGIKEVDVVDASNLMTRRPLLLEIGGFDPDYFYPHEDSDLCWRLRQKGYRIMVNFNSGVLHERSKRERMKIIYFTARARIRYQIKHFGVAGTNFINCLHKPTRSIVYYGLRAFFEETCDISKGPAVFLRRAFYSTRYNVVPIFTLPIDLARAIIWNIAHLNQTIASRGKNFLGEERLLSSMKKAAC